MLVIVTAVWVGYSFYSAQMYTDINTRAYSFTNAITNKFDVDTLDKLEDGVNELLIPSQNYHDLKDEAVINETEAIDSLGE